MADFLRILFSILLPPLGVFFQVGIGLHFWLNIVLTLSGYVPGLVHAVWIIARTPASHADRREDASMRRVSLESGAD